MLLIHKVSLRWDVDDDYESTMRCTIEVFPIEVDAIKENDVETLAIGISKLSIHGEKDELNCEQCGSTNKKLWTLRTEGF